MPKFHLDPGKSAMENLYLAARIATAVVMKRYGWYGLRGELRDELFDDIMHASVSHFLRVKVAGRKYARATKDGRRLDFMDNVLSSCWSASSWTVRQFMSRLTELCETVDIEPLKYSISDSGRLPLYMTATEKTRAWRAGRNGKPAGWDTLPAGKRAAMAREMYRDYLVEARELGLSHVLELGPWLTRNGYGSDDELFLALGDRNQWKAYRERKRLARKEELRRLEWVKENGPPRGLNQVLGEPPKGYEWVDRRGVGCLRKIRRIS